MTKQEILRQIETILDNAYDSEDLLIKFSFQKLEDKNQKSKFTFLLDSKPKKTDKERLSEELEKLLELCKNEKRGETPDYYKPQPYQPFQPPFIPNTPFQPPFIPNTPYQPIAPFYWDKVICNGRGIAACDNQGYFQDYNNTSFVKGYNYP